VKSEETIQRNIINIIFGRNLRFRSVEKIFLIFDIHRIIELGAGVCTLWTGRQHSRWTFTTLSFSYKVNITDKYGMGWASRGSKMEMRRQNSINLNGIVDDGQFYR
jgi:hypothetical protein